MNNFYMRKISIQKLKHEFNFSLNDIMFFLHEINAYKTSMTSILIFILYKI